MCPGGTLRRSVREASIRLCAAIDAGTGLAFADDSGPRSLKCERPGDRPGPFSMERMQRSAALLVDLVIGPSRVELAVGLAVVRVLAAEIEVRGQWIADRPFAGVLVELQQAQPLFDRDEQLRSLRRGLEFDLELLRNLERRRALDGAPRSTAHRP